MLGRKTLAADITLTTPTDFVTGQDATGALQLGFQVEEAEMLVDLEARIAYSGTAVGTVAFTVFIDGAASADIPAAGLWVGSVITDSVGDPATAYVRTTIRLPQGYHTAEVKGSISSGNLVYEGATLDNELVVRRHSHPATLGHGVDSKVQLIQ